MRALKRVLAVGALAAPLMIGCAGLAAAQEGLNADWGQGRFVANENGAGVAGASSSVAPDGVAHTDFWIWADDTGVAGSFTGSGATWNGE
ncbi:hypothetical protein ACFV1L_21420 [Kitasatospora sp. NPDC059646]|uniref:hypothetical protein n=1 Tax=Kitasatospora sp. NPDC059646 TaxID=3346893 RepID=UPI0036B2F3CD